MTVVRTEHEAGCLDAAALVEIPIQGTTDAVDDLSEEIAVCALLRGASDFFIVEECNHLDLGGSRVLAVDESLEGTECALQVIDLRA